MSKRKIEPAPLDQVHIVWEDAWHNGSTWDERELKEHPPFLVHATGFIALEDKHRIILASEYHPISKNWRSVHSIPKSLIRKREIVKKGKRKK